MKFRRMCLSLVPALVLAVGCSKNSTEPNEVEELSDSEQISVVAAEVAQSNGGAMSDLNMVASNSEGNYGTLSKGAGFDTTITKGWITYNLDLSFYTQQGIPQNRYVQGLTDKVVSVSSLTGNYSDPLGAITIALKTGSNLTATGLKAGNVTINGAGTNGSSFSFAGNRRQLSLVSGSSYTVSNVVINLNGASYIPSAGTLQGTAKGTFTVTGAEQTQSKDYSFTYTLTFNGNNQVTVTLPSGKQYTLNLVTGKYN